MLLPLLLFLVSLQNPAAASLDCERRHLDHPDSNYIKPIFDHGCRASGLGWAGIKPENKFKTHNFGPNTDTYELSWRSLVRWPACVARLQVRANNNWQNVTTHNPAIYEVEMPDCKRIDSFELELRIFFPGLLSINPDKCIVVNLGLISHTMLGISDYLYSLRKTPETELSGVNLNIYWLRNKVKLSKCLDRVEVSSNKDNSMKISIKPEEGIPFFSVPRKCQAQIATVTYFFKANLFPDNIRTINVPPLKSMCKNKRTIDTVEDSTTAKGSVGSETETNKNKTQIPTKSTKETSATVTTLTRGLVIGLGAAVIIAPITLCLLVICVKRCRKKPEEETEEDFAGDLNEDYGVYYSAGERVETESEVRDYNPDYETGEEKEDVL